MIENITSFNFLELDKFDKIFCLISGGIDSTYLFHMINNLFHQKTYAVNCYNPYEKSDTLLYLKRISNFIEIKPLTRLDYLDILKKAFLNLTKSFENKKYTKKDFGCCQIIKHKAFFNSEIFKEENVVVISGIKYGDGMQRRLWLKSLIDGKTTTKGTIITNAPTFYHRHKGGQLYCYPFRDYRQKELPKNIIDELRKIYPNLNHSGCSICPVLVRFEKRIRKQCLKNNDIETLKRLENSIKFAKDLDVYV